MHDLVYSFIFKKVAFLEIWRQLLYFLDIIMEWDYRFSVVPNDPHVDIKLCGTFNQGNKEFSWSLIGFIDLIPLRKWPSWIFFPFIQLTEIWFKFTRDFSVMFKYSLCQIILLYS